MKVIPLVPQVISKINFNLQYACHVLVYFNHERIFEHYYALNTDDEYIMTRKRRALACEKKLKLLLRRKERHTLMGPDGSISVYPEGVMRYALPNSSGDTDDIVISVHGGDDFKSENPVKDHAAAYCLIQQLADHKIRELASTLTSSMWREIGLFRELLTKVA